MDDFKVQLIRFDATRSIFMERISRLYTPPTPTGILPSSAPAVESIVPALTSLAIV